MIWGSKSPIGHNLQLFLSNSEVSYCKVLLFLDLDLVAELEGIWNRFSREARKLCIQLLKENGGPIRLASLLGGLYGTTCVAEKAPINPQAFLQQSSLHSGLLVHMST